MDGSEELIDIGRLTEEYCTSVYLHGHNADILCSVIESVVSAQRFERMSKSSIATHEYRNPNSHVPIYPSSEFTEANDVAVLLNIDKRESWWANLSPGSWTRIITNLVGKLTFHSYPTSAISLGRLQMGSDDCTSFLRLCAPLVPRLELEVHCLSVCSLASYLFHPMSDDTPII